jgi:hypothetical protein
MWPWLATPNLLLKDPKELSKFFDSRFGVECCVLPTSDVFQRFLRLAIDI